MNDLKSFRLALGWSQTKLGRKLGLDVASVSRIERGLQPLVPRTAKLLARLRRVPVSRKSASAAPVGTPPELGVAANGPALSGDTT